MNALLNTDDLKKWTGFKSLHDLTLFLNRMNIPYAECGETQVVSTLESVQSAFNSKQAERASEIIRIEEVAKIVKLCRSSIHLQTRDGRFPPKIKLGPKSVGWRKSDIIQWVEGKKDWSQTIDESL